MEKAEECYEDSFISSNGFSRRWSSLTNSPNHSKASTPRFPRAGASHRRGNGDVTDDGGGVDEVEGEGCTAKALRLFRYKILYMACSMEPSPESSLDKTDSKYVPSPDYDMVKVCRLVCKDWNEEISEIFRMEGKPLLVVNPAQFLLKRKRQVDPKSILETLSIPLVRPEPVQPHNSDLSFPPFKLHLPPTFFYKRIENAFVHAWKSFERHIFELQFEFPADASMRFYWPEMHLRNLKKIKFKGTYDLITPNRLPSIMSYPENPFKKGNYMYLIQAILNSARNAEEFTFHCFTPNYAPDLHRLSLPVGIKILDVPLIIMNPNEVRDCLDPRYFQHGGYRCVSHLTIRAPLQAFRPNPDITGVYASFMVEKYANSLEHFAVDVSGQDVDHIVWTMRRDYVYEPFQVEIRKPLKSLKSLIVHAGNWEISEMPCYEKYLPSLKTLKLTLIDRGQQIETLYTSRSETVEHLKLSFISEIPAGVISGFVDNLPFLTELDVSLRESDPDMQMCFRSFLGLRKLHVSYSGSSSQAGRDKLNWAITGIPMEVYGLIHTEELTMIEAIQTYGHYSSLRDLKALEEFKFNLRNNNSQADVSIMLRTTFLRMPTLKRVILSQKTLMIEEDQKDNVRKENLYDLTIQWI